MNPNIFDIFDPIIKSYEYCKKRFNNFISYINNNGQT